MTHISVKIPGSFNRSTTKGVRVGLGLCCLMTPGLSKDIQCHV